MSEILKPIAETFGKLSTEFMYIYEYSTMIDVKNETKEEVDKYLKTIASMAMENMLWCEKLSEHFEEGNRKLEQIEEKNNKLFTR